MRKLKLEELGRLSPEEFKEASKHPVHILLDNIRSMHNVGAVLRSADAFLVEKVYLCGITPSPPHREIRKTAIGAEESVAWEVHANAMDLVAKLKREGFTLLALEQTASSLPLPDFQPNLIQEKYLLILGHEVDGVRQELIDLCDVALEIPQFGTKHSLNVSVAAGIALYQLVCLKGKT
jgi:tRNA G18 (ribose-2'-O)-methylase SpoU